MTKRLRMGAMLAVLPLMLLPGLASARDCAKPKDVTASTCMPGATWDEATSGCVANPSS